MEVFGFIGERAGIQYPLHKAVFDGIANVVFWIWGPIGSYDMSTKIQIRIAVPNEESIIGEMLYKMELKMETNLIDEFA